MPIYLISSYLHRVFILPLVFAVQSIHGNFLLFKQTTKLTNGQNCLNIREICIVRRQNALRETTFFPPNDEATLVSELQRVQNQYPLLVSMNSNDRPHRLVNYSFTDDSDEESDLQQSNGDTTGDEDIPSDEQQSGQMAQQTNASE